LDVRAHRVRHRRRFYKRISRRRVTAQSGGAATGA